MSTPSPVAARPLELASMRIDVLRARTTDGVAMSFSPLAHRTVIMVTLTGTDGTTGQGESWANFPAWAPAERLATLVDGIAPLLRADPAGTPAEFYERLTRALAPIARQWGAPGPIAQAISGVDIALWDLSARTASTSVATEPVRSEIAAYASSLGPTGHDEQVARVLEDGYRALKVKIGFGRAADESALKRVRETAGDEIEIFADANQAWSPQEAEDMIPILREHGVAWIEEPIAGDRLEDLLRLHDSTGFPIATGENAYGVDEFDRRARSGAFRLLQPDVSKIGGLTPALAATEAARTAGCAVAPHLFNGCLAYAATLQLAAMNPAVQLVESDIRQNPLRDELLIEPPPIKDGIIKIPAGPGLGVDLNTEHMRRYLIDSVEVAL